ncbi:MAG TPA: CARDB domain-containing protein, partial [Tepidisphaeraceae bacterium]
VVPIPYADLSVSNVTPDATGGSGQPLRVSWTVTNNGIGITNTASWADSVFLATDPAGNNIVTSLGSFDHKGRLAVGGSYSREALVTLPDGLTGTFFVVVKTGGPFEFIYTQDNSAVGGPVTITLTTPPDLTVDDITAPVTALAGQKIDIAWRVHNIGAGDASGTWTDSVFLKKAGDPNAPLIPLGAFGYNAGLQAGKFYDRSEQFTLPTTLQGLFQAVVVTNTTASLFENGAIANNALVDDGTLLVSLPVKPDIQVQSVTIPASVSAGGTIAVDFKIINQGTVATAGQWKDNVYLSLDNQVSGDDVLIGSFDSGSALDPGETYRTLTPGLVIPKRYRGNVFILVQADANNSIDEFPNDNNNLLAKPLNVIPLPPSDLVTSNVVAPTQTFDDSTIQVRFTVSNPGIGETDVAAWTDTVWLTRDRKRPNVKKGDILLGSFAHNGSLKPGESYDQVVNVHIPATLSGEMFITPWSDAYDVVTEDTLSNIINPDDPNELDNNNYKARPITVVLRPPADLVITTLTPDATALAGGPFNVTWTVQNQGAADTLQDSWIDAVYLSDKPTLTGARLWTLGNFAHSGILGAGKSYTQTQTINLSPATAGQFVIVVTDFGRNVFEGPFTDNNTKSTATSVTTTPADLQVTAVVTPPQNFSGEKATISWTVKNFGATVWPGTRYWQDQVFISPDATFIQGRAIPLGTFVHTQTTPLASNATYTQTQDVTLPRGIGGQFYIYVIADVTQLEPDQGDNAAARDTLFPTSVYEGANGFNNMGSAPIPVTYREPDLKVTNLVVPATPPSSGATIPLSFTVSNIGTRDTREAHWFDRVYLSKDPSLDGGDQLLGAFERFGVLAKNANYTANLNVDLPDGVVGNFFILVFTDSNLAGPLPPENPSLRFEDSIDQTLARVGEYRDEGNNITAQPLAITLATPPDLQVTSITIPQSVLIGQSFDVTYQVTNKGLGPTPTKQNAWDDLFYLSRDQFLDLNADRFLGARRRTSGLNASGKYQFTESFAAPRDLNGAFYVIVIADPVRYADHPHAEVFELDKELNNATPSPQPLLIQLPPPSDLIVTNIALPGSAKSGDPVHLEWTVKNQGANPAEGSWSDALYLSTDNVWDINDVPLGRVRHTGTLAPGASYTLPLDVNLPPAKPGQYRIIVRPDIFNEVFEGPDESNNKTASASPLNVTVDTLQLGVPFDTNLDPGQVRLFQVSVGLDQTLKVDLTTPADTAFNELFLRFNDVPNGITFDASYTGPLAANQTAVIPSTQPGTYFILVRGQAEPGNDTPITLLADVIPLSITNVIPDQGGDSRWVTTTILGAQFKANAIVKLVRPGIAEFEPVQYQVVDSTRIIAIFDLRTAPHGLYDIRVTNPNGESATVPYRYLVERAMEPDVRVGLGGPRIIAPGNAGLYGFSLENLTNVDLPYVNFTFGLPELGINPVLGLKYVVMSTNLRGSPGVSNVPWADLNSQVNTTGEILAPGYAIDLGAGSFAGLSFTALTYPGLKELLAKNPHLLDDVDDEDIAFKFHITASATPMTRDEFIAQQTTQALALRDAIIADDSASQALRVLASDPAAWTALYLTGLQQAGLLRPEDVPPAVRLDPNLTSLMSVLAAGILAGPAGQQIISNADLPSFFAQVRKWYGNDDSKIGSAAIPNASDFDLKLSRRTVFEAFNIYVPFGKVTFDPSFIDAPPPDFSQFFAAPGQNNRLATINGPLGIGAQQFLPFGQPLPYSVHFQNAANATSTASEVRIVTQLDPNLDPRSFRLGDMQIGGIQVHIPSGRGVFQGDFDFVNSKGFILRVTAGIDVQSNTVSWLFQAIDPDTGELIQDPTKGLLPPDDANGAGEGFVTWTATPKADLPTGTLIKAKARVLLNTAAPEDTLELSQTLDGVAPTTALTATPLTPGGTDFLVKWNATDDAGGSGIKGVTVYVAQDGGDFTIWLRQSTDTSAVYNGTPGHTYEFIALATDLAGNREEPPTGLTTPDDGSGANLGNLPTVPDTTQDLGPPAQPSPQPSTNPIFVQAQSQVPATNPATRPSEFNTVFAPFSGSAFVTGIQQSHANIGPMAILPLPDGSVIVSGGPNRGSLFRVGPTGGQVGDPIITLPFPIFDLAMDKQGRIWGATGGGPLLQLDPTSLKIIAQYGDSITQTIAVNPITGDIYVSSGDGIEIFNPATGAFRHYADLRVGNMTFSPEGELWAAVWPQRGDIVRFDNKAKPHVMLHFASPVDSLAFGQTGTKLEGLLFVSNNAGSRRLLPSELIMVDLATLRTTPIARGGTRGDIVRTTARGQVLLSQSNQIDVLNPAIAPSVLGTNPPANAIVALPLTSFSVTFDRDMDLASVTNPANYSLTGDVSGPVTIDSINYDPDTRTAVLNFNSLKAEHWTFKALASLLSQDQLHPLQDFTSVFTSASDFSDLVDIQLVASRSDRANGTVSYDVKVTSKATNDLLAPLLLVFDPATYFAGQPVGSLPGNNGLFLLDIGQGLAGGVLHPGQSTAVRTITIGDPGGTRANFGHSVFALPTANTAPLITSQPVTAATVGTGYAYQVLANDPDGVGALTYFLYASPDGMTINPASGLISWTPTTGSPQTATVELRVYDSRGGFASQRYDITVAGVN